ncbi:MAG: 23S rRNA (adenine(2503)-C(2))-methyltransferase RlmN [Bacillota bacterium]|nr:23S rRNA (adenine(2503)-C(2))-methyltransferase RlmN [Bacillota bacterium]
MKEDIKSLPPEKLAGFLAGLGQPKYRTGQIFAWLYRGVYDFDEMTDLSLELRELLKETAYIERGELLQVRRSRDGTRKYLLGFKDGEAVESVFMKYKYGNSACVSSQAGCRMGCAFCASALKGLSRNLTAGEMAEEIIAMEKDTGEKCSHVVVMGTGEPLDNYQNLARFLSLIHEKKGLALGYRNVTVSTCGLLPAMERLRREFPQVNLAVSLHAPNQSLRSRLMPVARQYQMDRLLAACREHGQETGRRVTFEYALIEGFNDQPAHGEELANRLSGMLCHVNLIPLNPVSETPWKGSDRKTAEAFKVLLERRGVPVTLRRSLGADIDAACGQLRLCKGGPGKVQE